MGFLIVEPGFGEIADLAMNDWLKTQMETIMNIGDKLKYVEKYQDDIEALEARLNGTVEELKEQKAEVDRLKKENEDIQTRLNATEEEVDKLKQSAGNAVLKIAFSASLSNSGEIYNGPSTEKTLIFKKVFSNTGNGYNQDTGIFTAPVNGLYYFNFNTYGYNTHAIGALLMKNGAHQISTYDNVSSDGSDSSSNAAVLKLVAGDKVWMQLWENGRVFDNLNGHTTFSGFLLFTV
ncbi:complement C1q tumor necrosis factor-related protein 3-like [Scomber japonicus]|uniref:complement C1q tumor necrosis factor-related protein 3-like n=1 Tax=Scomber japonicus TaxID=13676 RepID=UPI002305493F|nr:complement C1q tumor necrosis factor-related protein 3-like [Scomber japonicus]